VKEKEGKEGEEEKEEEKEEEEEEGGGGRRKEEEEGGGGGEEGEDGRRGGEEEEGGCIYIYMYMCVYTYMCACMHGRRGWRQRGGGWRRHFAPKHRKRPSDAAITIAVATVELGVGSKMTKKNTHRINAGVGPFDPAHWPGSNGLFYMFVRQLVKKF
jgi:hypothetical protein